MQNLALNFSLNPVFNVQSFNAILGQVKQSLGAMGDTIKPIDEAKFNASIASIREKAKQAAGSFDGISVGADNAAKKVKGTADETEKLKTKAADIKSVFGSGLSAMALGFNQTLMATQALANGLGKIINASEDYRKNLLAVGAFTGTTGEALEDLGNKARAVGKAFGSTGAEQLTIFSSVLSKMGPSYAQNADAMQKFATNANILAKAGGIELSSAVEVMNNSILMFGLRTGDAAKDAETSTRIINGLAASARAGAAPIGAVGESILQAGVMAKGSKVSFEETAAAIQVLSVGGKTGSEAGVALRNVMGLLQKPTAEAEAGLRKMGLTGSQLADILTNKGIGEAMKTLKDGMSKLSTDAERNNVAMKMFGMDNANAAGILMDNMDRYDEFLTSIKLGQEGVGTAFEMAAQKSGTATGNIKKMKAWVTDMWVSGGEAIGSYGKTILMASTQVAPMLMSFSAIGPVMGKIVGSAANLGLTLVGKVVPAIGATIAANTAAGVSGVAAFTSMAAAVWAAMAPLLPFVVAIGAIGVGLYALAGGFAKTTEEKLKDTQASIQNLEKQKEYNLKLQDQEKSNIRLIGVYEELVQRRSALAAEGKDTAKVEDQLNSVMEKLNQSYPNTINLTASHEENIKNIKQQTGLAGVETHKFTAENQALVKEYEKLGQKEKLSNAEKERMKIVTAALQEEFPGAIEGAKDFGAGLDVLKTQAGLSNNALKGLVNEMKGFADDSQRLNQILAVQKRDLIKDKLYKEFTTLGAAWTTSSYAALDIVAQFYDELYKLSDKSKVPDITKKYREMLKKNTIVDKDSKGQVEQAIIEMGQAQVTVLESFAKQKQDIDDKSNNQMLEADKTVYERRKATIENYAKQVEALGGKLPASIGKALKKLPGTLADDVNLKNLTQDQFTELNTMIEGMLKKQKATHELSAEDRLKIESDLSRTTEKMQKELDDKKQELSAKSIKKQSLREYQELQLKYKKELDKYDETIKELEAKKKNKDLSASNIAEINKQIEIQRGMFETQKQLQEKDIESFYKKITEEENKRTDELSKTQNTILQQKLEFFKSSLEYTSGAEAITKNLNSQAKLQIDITKNEADEKIKQILRQDKAYQELAESVAKWNLIKDIALSTNQPQLQIVATANLTLAEAAINSFVDKSLQTNEQIVLINQQSNRAIAQAQLETNNNISKARIQDIQDAAVRLREYAIFEAEITYKEELKLAKGNQQLEYEAFINFIEKKRAAQTEYLKRTQSLSMEVAKFLTAFTDSFRITDVDDNSLENETQNKRRELQQQEADLKRAYKNQEISTSEYYSKSNKIKQDAFLLEQANSKKNSQFVEGINRGILEASTRMREESIKAMNAYQVQYTNAAFAISEIDSQLLKIQDQNSAEYKDLEAKRAQASAVASKAIEQTYSELAIQVGASLGQALGEQKNIGKALVSGLFDILQGMVPMWAGMIAGWAFSSADSVSTFGITGATKTAIVSGLLTAAIQGFKSLSLSAFFKGGWTGDADPREITGVVHGREFVMDHKTTALNRPDFEIMQRNKMSLENYVLGYRSDITSKLVHDVVNDELAMKDEQINYLQGMLNEARLTNYNLEQLLVSSKKQELLLEEGNFKRKTLNQVDVDIHLDDNKLLLEVEKRNISRLQRI